LTASRHRYLAIRPWPPLSSDLKTVLVQTVLNGYPIALGSGGNAKRNGARRKIWALAKYGCFIVIHPTFPERPILFDLTHSGWVQALCADERVWINSGKMFSHLIDKMPKLASCWSTVRRASKTVCLGILAQSVRFAVSNREWFASNSWEPFERYLVLATFKSVDITEKDRERILSVIRNDSSSKGYFLQEIGNLFEHRDISAEERRDMVSILCREVE
jgi:hypothetical protein